MAVTDAQAGRIASGLAARPALIGARAVYCQAFPYFRSYGPLEAYFDKSWQLPDIEKVK